MPASRVKDTFSTSRKGTLTAFPFLIICVQHGKYHSRRAEAYKEIVQLLLCHVGLHYPVGVGQHLIQHEKHHTRRDILAQREILRQTIRSRAKHHKVLGNAMQGYKRLNARAISQIRPGGILFTFSCSQAVSKELFRTMIFSAAAIAGRNVRILHQLTQPADHPVSIYHPEGEYLKGLVLYVE